jgi:signal peptidase I
MELSTVTSDEATTVAGAPVVVPDPPDATAAPPARRPGRPHPAHRVRSGIRRRGPLATAWAVIETGVAIVAVVIGTLALIVAIASHLSSTEEYTVFGHPVLVVLSGSMSPTIRTGDLIYDSEVTASEASRLHAGEIITFRLAPGSEETITHRIHAVKSVGGNVLYQTKGDANKAPDAGLVAPSQVVGVYDGKVPYGGFVLNALHKPLALALLLLSPCLWLLSNYFFRLARRADDGNEPPAAARPGATPM